MQWYDTGMIGTVWQSRIDPKGYMMFYVDLTDLL